MGSFGRILFFISKTGVHYQRLGIPGSSENGFVCERVGTSRELAEQSSALRFLHFVGQRRTAPGSDNSRAATPILHSAFQIHGVSIRVLKKFFGLIWFDLV